MATDVKVPTMGESISSGILSAWLVGDGDFVSKDQPIYELETDKITSEATAEVSGIIKLKVKQDEEVDIGSIVAIIEEQDVPENIVSDTKTSTRDKVAPVPEIKEDVKNYKEEKLDTENSKTIDTKTEEGASLKVSPLAKKMAEDKGINLDTIKGSGPRGRIVKSDLSSEITKDYAGDSKIPKDSNKLKQADIEGDKSRSETRIKMSPLRKKIAEHLVNATQEAALLTTFNEVDMSNVIQIRKTNQNAFVEKYGIKLGFMSFFTKAVVSALKSVTSVNARIEGDYIVQQNYFDIGIAVGTDKGLMVPIVRNCDEKGFSEIEKTIADYANDAKKGKIQLSDLQGGVITISNGGIYGSMLSTPIINFPQPAILGLHNIQERAVVIDHEIVIRPMMYLALSYDHRLIDGKEAVTFLNKIKQSIENPDKMLIGL